MSGIVGYLSKEEKVPGSLFPKMIESIRYTESEHTDKWSDDFVYDFDWQQRE